MKKKTKARPIKEQLVKVFAHIVVSKKLVGVFSERIAKISTKAILNIARKAASRYERGTVKK